MAALAAAPVLALAEDVKPQDQLKPEWGAVLSPQEAFTFGSREGIDDVWTPTTRDIAEMEKLLPGAMRRAFDEEQADEQGARRIGDYYRQYYGIFVSGKRLIIVNGFHESHMQWKRKLALPSECSQFLGSDLEGEDGICAARGSWNPDDWRHELVRVSDGGCAYFGAAFNSQTKQFEYLGCQGYA